MVNSTPKARRGSIRAFFVRGLIAVLPLVVTLLILATAWGFVRDSIARPVTACMYWSLEGNAVGWQALDALGIDPADQQYVDDRALPLALQETLRRDGVSSPNFLSGLTELREANQGFFRDLGRMAIDGEKLRRDVQAKVPPIIGLFVSVLLVLTLGSLAGGYLGRLFVDWADQALRRIPIVRSVYPYTKQVVDFFLAEKKLDFDTVVALPYPNDYTWSLGFVTNTALRSLDARAGDQLLAVYIPASPMPMTGYTVFISAARVVPLDLSVDDALRIVVSGGVLLPPNEATGKTAAQVMNDVATTKLNA